MQPRSFPRCRTKWDRGREKTPQLERVDLFELWLIPSLRGCFRESGRLLDVFLPTGARTSTGSVTPTDGLVGFINNVFLLREIVLIKSGPEAVSVSNNGVVALWTLRNTFKKAYLVCTSILGL